LVTAEGIIQLRQLNITGSLKFVNQKNKLTESHVGEINVEVFDNLM
jgi:hypothetical protein